MACGSFSQYPQVGEICGDGEKDSGDVIGLGCGGSGSLCGGLEEAIGEEQVELHFP